MCDVSKRAGSSRWVAREERRLWRCACLGGSACTQRGTGSFTPVAIVGEKLVNRALRKQHVPVFGHVVRTLLYARGTDIPRSVQIGARTRFRHGASGVVVHRLTRIGDRVNIFHRVTFGRADIWNPIADFAGFIVEDDVIIGAGAAVISRGPEPLVLGRGSVIGANSVVLESTGPWEIWAGVPARKVGMRPPKDVSTAASPASTMS